jgi:predicted nucleic acid-binding protein
MIIFYTSDVNRRLEGNDKAAIETDKQAESHDRINRGECYGDIRSSLEKKGKNIGSYDLVIAAHVVSLGWTLVTNNEREFHRIQGLKIENWAKD